MSATRILHVDDEPDIREVVALALALDPDFSVHSCACGGDAIVVAAHWQPNMILLDVIMPVMDGPTTLAHLRGNPLTCYIPVVFMTARLAAKEFAKLRSLGAEGVIAKPFDPVTFAASVRSYLPRDTSIETLRKAFVRRELQNAFVRRAKMDAAILIPYSSALDDRLASRVVLQRVKDIAHGLAGSGGVFGFDLLSDKAAKLEDAAAACLMEGGGVDAVKLAISALLLEIDVTPLD